MATTVLAVLALSACGAQANAPANLTRVGSFLPGTVTGGTTTASAASAAADATGSAPAPAQSPAGSLTESLTAAMPSGPTEPSAASTRPLATTSSPTLSTDSAWTEDFTGPQGPPNPELFNLRTGGNGWGNQEIETYTTSLANASVDGSGHLLIRAVREQHKGTDGITRPWTSARMDSLGKWEFTTGTIEIRMKMQPGEGLWPAFWLEGSDVTTVGWPDCGEIDVAEVFGSANAVSQTVHGPNGTKAGYQYSTSTPAPKGTSVGDGYHTFSVTRSPGKIIFGIDGNVSGTLTPDKLKKGEKWAFDGPMFLLLNFAVGGFSGIPTAKTPSPATLSVDWIKYLPLTAAG